MEDELLISYNSVKETRNTYGLKKDSIEYEQEGFKLPDIEEEVVSMCTLNNILSFENFYSV